MAVDYGVLKDIVAISGSLIAAVTAIRLAWMRRARWMPPEESVSGATAKMSSLGCAVAIGILYLERHNLGAQSIELLAGIGFLVALLALAISIYINTAYTFIRLKHNDPPEGTRILGGFRLTTEAKKISLKKGLGPQKLYENSNYDANLVWTPASLAQAIIFSTFSFIILQLFGSFALAAISMAISLKL
jgi:hypothetical protein